MKPSISRRDFLQGSLATAGLTLAAVVTPFGYRIVNASQGGLGADPTFQPSVWFEIRPDNLVIVTVPNSEMGQGVRTALPMIVAEELDADWDKVCILQASVAEAFHSPILHAQVTVASASCRGFYEPLRKAGASGRAMLRTAAAQTWKVPEGECVAFNSTVKHKRSGRTLTYGELCGTAAGLPVPADPPLKKESEFRYLGKPMARVDIPDKVAGAAVFGLDVQVPGMLYASIDRPPTYGAKPGAYDEQAALAVRGVQKVAATPNGVAVVADTIEAAWKGRDALRVQWSGGSHPEMDDASIEKQFLADLDKPGVQVAHVGDVKKALGSAAKTYEAVYYVPFVAHATMETMNATAHVQADRCDIWAPTQNQTLTQIMGSKFAELPPEKVNVHTTLLGGGFGRRDPPDFIIDAVSVSKAVGKPVKVVWTREEDLKHDFYRAATAQKIQAAIDGERRVTSWSHKVACTSILRFLNPEWLHNGIDIFSLWGIFDFPGTPALSHTAYAFPNFYVEQYLSELPVPACPWRSVQNAPNAFIVESFMDELA
ncbi:MAG TPA: molybdopterin cofactor-binding domain-containing protein, partial [Deferrisomatales bacterium]|nr:molybdopterin cofactor-binding domain-containing protein [Deferrisomatales bacterium]